MAAIAVSVVCVIAGTCPLGAHVVPAAVTVVAGVAGVAVTVW